MKVIDISMELNEETPIYEGDPRFSRDIWTTIRDNGYVISKLRMGTHTGTHVDAPQHFLERGKSVREISVHRFIGRCYVTSDINNIPAGYERVLINSRNGGGRLTPAEAEMLVNRRVRLIGTDKLSIGEDKVHRILLTGDCMIIEGLVLNGVEDGEYTISAAPLKMDTDGSPIRAVLMKVGPEDING